MITTLIVTLVLCGLVTALYLFLISVDNEHKRRKKDASDTKGDKI